jgi:catechol 2,3-dioxygenase-like lactoylglutathione lyase family enzyme
MIRDQRERSQRSFRNTGALAVLSHRPRLSSPRNTSGVAEPRLFRVILPVSNIEVATSFYAELLGMPGDRVSPGHHYFSCGDTILACHDALADGDPARVGPNPQPFYFSVDDPEAIHERVRRIGGADVTPIESRPWGERSFYANDRWGFHLLRGLEDVLYPQQRLARPLTRGLRQAS